MRRRFLILTVVCAALSSAAFGAETFDGRFDEGYSQLRAGDPGAALASFQQLLTENPDSELVQYSIAAATYEKGLLDLEAEVSEEGFETLRKAKDGFDLLLGSQNSFLKSNAPFSSANCSAQVARHMDPNTQYNERVQHLQEAIQAYETHLRVMPDHAGAKTNLNHTRYLLKKMLQNPPPDQEKADEGDGGEEGQEGSEENEEGEEGEEQENPEDGQEGENDESEGEMDESDSSDQNQDGDPRDSASDGDPLEDENLEAILQSLEEKNKEEQKNLRKAKGPPQIRDSKWW